MRKTASPWCLCLALAPLCVLPGRVLIANQAVPPAPAVTLLDAGAAARQPFRYSARAGDRISRQVSMRMSVSSTLDGVQMPLPPASPAISMRINLDVVSVALNGDMTINFEYSNASVADAPGIPDAILSTIRGSVASINGTRGRMVMSSRGGARDAAIDLPAGAAPELKQQLNGLYDSLSDSAPLLPEEPIGVGAQWRTERQTRTQGIPVKYVSTYTLKAINAGVLLIEADVAYSTDEHAVELNGVPGANARINSLTGKGVGRYTIGPGEVMPRDADMSVTSDSAMTLTIGGASQKMQQSLVMKVLLAEVAAQPSR